MSVGKKQWNAALHIVIWVSYAAFNHVLNIIMYKYPNIYVSDTIAKYTMAALIFYTNTELILPLFFRRGRYLWYALSLLALSFLILFIREFLYDHVFTMFGYTQHNPYTFWNAYLMNLWWWFQYSLFGHGYFFAKEMIKKQKEKAELERQKAKVEYDYLKAQINPHFFYNALNFLYSKSLTVSEELSNGILTLAEVMRYSVDNSEDLDGNILVIDEVQQIERVIEINRLRYDDLSLDFNVHGDISKARIIPFVLLTLVENAFKHGDITSKEHPVIIDLHYEADAGKLSFKVSNKKSKNLKARSYGIGMDNIRKRLAMTYKDGYNLHAEQDDKLYSVTLSINSQ